MIPGLVRPVPTPAAPGTAAAAVAVATSQLGYVEGPGNLTVFGEAYGMNGAPWCAVYQWYVNVHSGCDAFLPKAAYTPTLAEWFQRHALWGRTPRVGAYFFLYGDDGNGQTRIHHTGRVTAITSPDTFVTAEGNWQNGVRALRRSVAGLGSGGGFGYPAYKSAVRPAPVPAPRPKPASPGHVLTIHGGDSVSVLVAAHGPHGADWRAVWADRRNAGLRALRHRPELIRPGDRLWVP